MEEGKLCGRRNKHTIAEVKVAIVEQPVRKGGACEQGRSIIQGCESLEDKRVRGQGGLYVVCQSEIQGIDDHGVREDGSMSVVCSGVVVVLSR